MAKSLYICYFGIREPLVQTQVIPYLREIAKGGTEVSLLTFEPDFRKAWPREQIEKERQRMDEIGIDWYSLPYHKRPSAPATAYDVLVGARFVRKFIKQKKPDVLHVRGHIPAPMALIARKFSAHKPKVLFDIRGFMPEEYTDAGVWQADGLLFRAIKRLERWLMRESDGFVVLTEAARAILFPESIDGGRDRFGRPVEVIPCCVDLKRFQASTPRIETRRELDVDDRFVVIYVGSLGGWYMEDEMLDFFTAVRSLRSDLFVVVLTQRDKEKIEKRLRERGFEDSDFLVKSVKPAEISTYLLSADLAVSFIRACYSKLSSSPTKLAEYLACGVPIIANRGVGDVDFLIEGNRVGVLVHDFSEESYIKAVKEIEALGDIRDKCRSVAASQFELESIGGERYRRLYANLLEN